MSFADQIAWIAWIFTQLTIGKIFVSDKVKIQSLHELSLGYRSASVITQMAWVQSIKVNQSQIDKIVIDIAHCAVRTMWMIRRVRLIITRTVRHLAIATFGNVRRRRIPSCFDWQVGPKKTLKFRSTCMYRPAEKSTGTFLGSVDK